MLLYLIYITWTALASRPNESCNPFYHEDSGTILQIIFGLIFTFIALSILASGTKDNRERPENKFKNVVADDDIQSDDEIEEETPAGDTNKESYVFPVATSTLIFQGFMVFVSIYYAMLITNWGRPTVDDDNYDYFIDKWAGFWIKVVVQWVMCILYLFSLIAPLLFKNREF